nr:retrovirus-related Pol polyprotein from transposon TNT 1-94 [Tanacetum cinerariifolium]
MANLSKDIQCAGFDTQPLMLDRTDFTSWQQRIRLYYQGKEDRVNILNSIDEGPFQMGTFRETLVEGNEGALHLGPERPRNKGETIHDYYVWFAKLINDMRNIKMTMSKMQLNSKFVNNMLPEWGRFVTTVKLNKGLRDSNYDQLYAYLKQHEAHLNKNKMMLGQFTQHTVDPLALMSNVSHQQGQGNNARETGIAGYEGAQNRVRNTNPGQARQIKCYNCDGGLDNVDDDVDEKPVQDLALNVDNVFQADEYPVYDEAGPSYDSDILSEVHDHDNYQDAVCKLHGVHEMHEHVQPNCIVDSNAEYTSDSNMIPYDQYVKDNAESVVQNTVSSVPHDAPLMIIMICMNRLPKCVKKKVKIAPHDQSKENYFATFTPQKQLTPEQIFWSKDLIKMKPEAFKEQTLALRPIKALMVYPPNTPAILVPTVLPTKRLNEGERGFEQRKTCYLTEVIPFLKTIKEHFEGIQKALINEIKEMKEVFDQMEAEVDRHAVDKKCDEIE